jgi:hypothetical protein
MSHPEWLALAAARSVEHPWSVGYALARFGKDEGKTREQLAAELGCEKAQLDWLSLCRRPDPLRFTEHVHEIAERYGLPALKLASIFRRVDALDALDTNTPEANSHGAKVILLAARDRSSGEGSGP